jgi:hypothetical protein
MYADVVRMTVPGMASRKTVANVMPNVKVIHDRHDIFRIGRPAVRGLTERTSDQADQPP